MPESGSAVLEKASPVAEGGSSMPGGSSAEGGGADVLEAVELYCSGRRRRLPVRGGGGRRDTIAAGQRVAASRRGRGRAVRDVRGRLSAGRGRVDGQRQPRPARLSVAQLDCSPRLGTVTDGRPPPKKRARKGADRLLAVKGGRGGGR